MAIDCALARLAFQKRDYERALPLYRTIIEQLKEGTTSSSSALGNVVRPLPHTQVAPSDSMLHSMVCIIKLPVHGSVLWNEYVRCIAAVEATDELLLACEHILSTQHRDIDLLFFLADTLCRFERWDKVVPASLVH